MYVLSEGYLIICLTSKEKIRKLKQVNELLIFIKPKFVFLYVYVCVYTYVHVGKAVNRKE
jgi:hypothetical protein